MRLVCIWYCLIALFLISSFFILLLVVYVTTFSLLPKRDGHLWSEKLNLALRDHPHRTYGYRPHDNHNPSIDFSNGKDNHNAFPTKTCSYAILLQQSPVDAQTRPIRLSNIDNTWATWSKNMCLYAAIPIDTKQPPSNQSYQTIRKIFLPPSKPAANPFQNLVYTLLSLYDDDAAANLEWIIIANDHTFFIPPNLEAFLSKLDPKQLIYTGTLHSSIPISYFHS